MRQSLLNNTPLVVDKHFEGVRQGEFNQWQVFYVFFPHPSKCVSHLWIILYFSPLLNLKFFFSSCEWMGEKGVLNTTVLRNHLCNIFFRFSLHGSCVFWHQGLSLYCTEFEYENPLFILAVQSLERLKYHPISCCWSQKVWGWAFVAVNRAFFLLIMLDLLFLSLSLSFSPDSSCLSQFFFLSGNEW